MPACFFTVDEIFTVNERVRGTLPFFYDENQHNTTIFHLACYDEIQLSIQLSILFTVSSHHFHRT